ncbi:MAG: hypothetical protein H0V30_00335 [Chitinophagaceae bacterium]|jgi:hypothetical protein|nr:hypothetical protein [Chitinophagaceae bacterium]
MKNRFFLTLALIAFISVFAISCTTSRVYGDDRYSERTPYGYYDRYGIYDPYGYYGGPMRAYPNRYYGDRYYYGRTPQRNPNYENRNREKQQQNEERRQENTRKIENSKEKVLGRGN